MNNGYKVLVSSLATASIVFGAAAAFALDTPSLSIGNSGHGKQALMITAGSSGLPNGFTVWWMDDATFASNGRQWSTSVVPGQSAANFDGAPTLNTFGGQYTTFEVSPNASIEIEIGDLFEETGVAGDRAELKYGTQYHFVVFANDGTGQAGSALSATVTAFTTESTNCTYTQGYWKNHLYMWPTTSLMLGTVNYTQAQLSSIFGQAVMGNGLVSLAHQLIAAKLNIANGADPTDAASAIASADALIGSLVVPPVGGGSLNPSATSTLTQTLDDYNNGVTGPGHCGAVSVKQSTWGAVKSLYR